MKLITSPPPANKIRGKWDFIPKMTSNDCLVFETQEEADKARRAIYWHGFKPISRKTKEGWKVWKLPASFRQG